jgi:hypothetical protein
MAETELEWKIEEPGTLALKGTEFWILYDPDPDSGNIFSVHNGPVEVSKADRLAVAKDRAVTLFRDLMEIGMLGYA